MKAGSRTARAAEQPSSRNSQSSQSFRAAEQKQPVAACLTLKDWVCCWSAMNSSLPPGCNAWKVIARLQ